jgi:hypothetical protein
MEDDIENAASDLRAAITDFLLPLQTSRVVRRDDFVRLRRHTHELMRLLKGRDLVSKALMNELFSVPLIIRAEIPYFKTDASDLDEMAGEIELCFSLLLKDEVPEDRIPGVPRII